MNSLNFPNGSSPVMSEFLCFHDEAMVFLIFICMVVSMFIYLLYKTKFSCSSFIDQALLELFWTLFPAMTLIILALPSLKLLYYLDVSELVMPNQTMKSVGHQWYWNMSFFFNKKEYNSDMYMVPTDEMENGGFRKLETDSVMIAPVNQIIRLLLSSDDVIHSFTLPNLGLKMDAVPGRMKSQYFSASNVGIYYGQCSEICGANHSFMPITLEVYWVMK